VDPDYFLRRMQWWEVQLYLDGLNMRDRATWESTRFMTHSIACMFCKDVERDQRAWMPLPWEQSDEDTDQPEITEDYVEQMRDLIRRENEQLKAQG